MVLSLKSRSIDYSSRDVAIIISGNRRGCMMQRSASDFQGSKLLCSFERLHAIHRFNNSTIHNYETVM